MRGIRGATGLLAFALTLAGCTGDDNAPAAAADRSATPAAAVAAPTCTDGRDDSVSPQLDLHAVELIRTGDRVRVIVRESGLPPGSNAVVWVVGFISADGEDSVELEARLVDGTETSHAVLSGERRQILADPVRITQNAMTTTFPVERIDALGPGTRWYATLSSNGAEIDYCPGGAELRDFLDIVPLPLPEGW